MEFKANNDTMFSVPCVVADNMLKLVDGAYIKVLLYILRYSGKDCTEAEISLNTGVEQSVVKMAIDFWKNANILTCGNDTSPAGNIPENPAGQPVAKTLPMQQRKNWSAGDIAEIKTKCPDIAELFEMATSTIGILNYTQQNSLIYMHEYLGLKTEVIMILINYCKEIKKTNSAYIESIARSWSDNNINSHQLAQEEVSRLMAKYDYIEQVKKVVGTERLSSGDKELIDKWHTWSISIELIEQANDLTNNNIHKISFPYMSSIIEKWHEKGITDIEGIQKESESHRKNSPYVHKDNDFDIDMYKIFINDFEVI